MVNVRCGPNVVLVLDHHRRWWASINTTIDQRRMAYIRVYL